MKPTLRTLLSPDWGRVRFFITAFVAIIAQMALLAYALGTVKTIMWQAGHPVAAILHSGLIWSMDTLVLLLPCLLIGKRWRWVQWPVLILFNVWAVCQMMYFPTYADLMPPSSFMLWQNLDGMVLASALANWRLRGWVFLLPMVALTLADVWWHRHYRPCRLRSSWGKRALVAVGMLLVMRIVADVLAYTAHWHNEENGFTEFVADNYTHVRVTHSSYLAENGLACYLAYCAGVQLAQHHDLTAAETRRVEQFLNGQPHYTDTSYDSHRQNLILIIVESLNSWVVDFRLDGREVTPVLNRLCADTASIVGRHMRRQVQNGGSSDAHFMYNTGLLPLVMQSVAMVYGQATYPTLTRALHRSRNIHVCIDPPTLWNTETTSRTYGYDTFVGGKYMRRQLADNDWQCDKVVFDEATRRLPELGQPFVAQIVTLGMHEPYNKRDVPETWISRSRQYTQPVRFYLERTAVLDRSLGRFLDCLKRQGLYDNSLIVIASDHNDHIDDDPHGRPAIDPDGRDCLLLVLNSGQGRVIEKPFGQIDIYPTLLDLMGANANEWKGLGLSLMRNAEIGTAAMSPSQTTGTGPLLSRQVEAWDISRMMITGLWFERHGL